MAEATPVLLTELFGPPYANPAETGLPLRKTGQIPEIT